MPTGLAAEGGLLVDLVSKSWPSFTCYSSLVRHVNLCLPGPAKV